MRYIDRIVIHCSATPPSMDIGVNTIRDWHVNGNGWSDVGYHFVIQRNGNVQKGRPLERTGAHSRGFNKGSIGICYIGGVNSNMRPEDNRTQEQKDAMRELINDLSGRFEVKDICGHCDLPRVTKACPSFNVKEWLYGED